MNILARIPVSANVISINAAIVSFEAYFYVFIGMINIDVMYSILFSVNFEYLFKQITGKICLNSRKHGNFTSLT